MEMTLEALTLLVGEQTIQIRALNLQVAALTDERDALEAQVESDRGTGRAQE